MSEYKNKKTTCNKKAVSAVLPAPSAEVVAELTGVSPSYAKKIINGNRPAKTQTATKVKECYELIVDTQSELLQIVADKYQN